MPTMSKRAIELRKELMLKMVERDGQEHAIEVLGGWLKDPHKVSMINCLCEMEAARERMDATKGLTLIKKIA